MNEPLNEPSELLVATNNAGKVRELALALADLPLRLRLLKDFAPVAEPEETGETFAENAALKALYYSAHAGLPTLSDDSGLVVDALGGAPGVRSARYVGPDATYAERIARLLKEIDATGDTERRARFVCVIAVAEPSTGELITFEGRCEGRIARSPRGTGGFGYDPVFIPEGHSQTFGELPDEIKQTISHRALAVAKAGRYLRERFRKPAVLNNRYRVLSVLGRGGFGQTYLVEDTQLFHKRRVVKQLKPQTNDPDLYPSLRDRFRREAETLERLGEASDQIPTLHAYFSEGGEFYLVQDWVEGKSLTQKVRQEGALDESKVRELLTGILPVLDFVHSRGVIHRDISPNNVMIRESDGKPVLIDFGAVKEVVTTVFDADGFQSGTMAIGAPGYMPLEQQAGRPVFASDIFSLGLTAVYALTGKHPQQLHDLRTGDISWREHVPGVSRKLAEALDKSVEYHAHNRFQTARQMLDALAVDSDARAQAHERRPPKVFRVGKSAGETRPAEEVPTQISEETLLWNDSDGRGASPVNINDRCVLLIRINQNYREGMSAEALYDATRGIWRLGPRRERARYAMAVYRGIVLEVYVVERWHPAGETFVDEKMRVEGRWEFTGRTAPGELRDRYVGRSVAHYFKRGEQGPVKYVNCPA